MRRLFFVSLLLIVFAAVAMSQQNPNPPSSNSGSMPGMSGSQSNTGTQSNTGSMQGMSGMQSNTSQNTGNSATENTIFQTEKNLWDAWKNHNPSAFQQNMSQNAVDVSESGVKTGQQNVIQDLSSGNCQVNNYALSDQKFTWYDANHVLLTYRADQDATCNGQKLPSSVYASSLWVNEGGKWQAAFHQETPAQSQMQQSQQPH